jgi:hypothetical protein
MRHSAAFTLLLIVAVAGSGCDTTPFPTLPTDTSPAVETTESFSDTLTVNGGRTHPFSVQRAGTVTAQVTSLSDLNATIGLSLGTWNGTACQIILANDSASINVSLTGTAQTSGQFCVRLYDVGRLTAAVSYAVLVTHF